MLHGVLHKYPFLLPSALGSVFSGVAFVLCYFFLDETLPRSGYQEENEPLITSKNPKAFVQEPEKIKIQRYI